MTTISRRGMVRLVSYTAALVVALSVAAAGGYAAANRYRTTIEYGYQRALGELSEYISNLDITLQKGRYATTENQLQGLASKLWREAGSAKSCLEQLPLDGGELGGIHKFLSQVGNFCMSLSHRVSDGGEITEEETAALQKLSAYAGSMTVRLAEMEAGLNTGALSFGEVSRRLQEDDPGGAAVPDLQQSFLEMEEELADYPTISIVLDVHRDALVGSDGEVYKLVSQEAGEKVAQVMLVVGSNDTGLEHPRWTDNLAFAVRLQKNLVTGYDSLARPIVLRSSRYNQQLLPGYLLVEVGGHGNTLGEAMAGARLWAV